MRLKGPPAWFVLNAAAAVVALVLADQGDTEFAQAAEVVGLVGGIMLSVGVAGLLGMPMKGGADPIDVVAGAAGILTVGLLLGLLGVVL